MAYVSATIHHSLTAWKGFCVFDIIIWLFQEKVIFHSLYLFSKKLCSKCKLQFLTENLRKSLVLNGLCLVWPILDPKNKLLLISIVSKSLWLAVLEDLFGIGHKNLKLIIFSTYLICITKVNRWVKLGLKGMKLWKVIQ